MAHSAPDPLEPRTTSQGLSARTVVIIVVFVLVSALLTVVIWSQGGFAATADDREPQGPGTEIRNDLFTVTPTKAETRSGVDESAGNHIVVRAKLTSHENEPENGRTFTDELMEAQLLPAKAEGEMGMVEQVRDSGTHPITWVQPGVTETVLLVWRLPEDVAPEDVERVRLRVLEAEESKGFIDERARWWSLSEDSVGDVDLPVEAG